MQLYFVTLALFEGQLFSPNLLKLVLPNHFHNSFCTKHLNLWQKYLQPWFLIENTTVQNFWKVETSKIVTLFVTLALFEGSLFFLNLLKSGLPNQFFKLFSAKPNCNPGSCLKRGQFKTMFFEKLERDKIKNFD